MKTLLRLSLSLSLVTLACQPPVQQSLPPILQGTSQGANSTEKPQLQGTVTSQLNPATGRPQLTFQVGYRSQAGFRTQALDCSRMVRFQVSVSGINIPATMYATGATGAAKTVPATSPCQITNATIPNVPSGEARVAKVTAYDNEGNAIGTSTLSAVFDVTASPTTVNLSYRSTPAALIIEELLTQNPVLATSMDRDELQTLIDRITGADGDFPDIDYTNHPLFVDREELLQDLINNHGNDILDLTPADYLVPGGTVSGSISGLVGGDTVTVQLTDPLTGAIVGQTNGDFNFTDVPPGDWVLVISWPPEYIDDGGGGGGGMGGAAGFSIPVNVGSGQNVVTPTVALKPVVPMELLASQVGEQSFHLQWSEVPDAQSYNVYKDGVLLQTVNASELELLVTTLNPAQTYQMKVSAVINGQEGPLSDALPVTTLTPYSGWVSQGLTGVQVSAIATDSTNTQKVYVGTVGSRVQRTVNAGQGDTWEQVGVNPQMNNISALVIHPQNSQILYAGTDQNGVYKTIDGGTTWQSMSSGLSVVGKQVLSLVIDPDNPNIVYVGTNGEGVFVSQNGGDSWSAYNALNSGELYPMASQRVSALSIYNRPIPFNNLVYAGTSNNGVYRGEGVSGPSNWKTINEGFGGDLGILSSIFLQMVYVTSLVPHPSNVNLVYGAGTGSCLVCSSFGSPNYQTGIWQRNEPGAWNQIGHNGTLGYPPGQSSTGLTDMQIKALAIDPNNPNTLFAASASTGVFRSTNAGTSWELFSTGLSDANSRKINTIAMNSASLYIGTNSGVFRAQ